MEEKRTRHQKMGSWGSGKRLEILKIRIKWNFKGITLCFIPNKNTCQNSGSKNCITGFFFLWSFFVSHTEMLHDERSKQVVSGTLSFCLVLNYYLRQHRIWILQVFPFSSCFTSSVLSTLFYYKKKKKKPHKMRRKTTALKLQLYSQTRHTALIDVHSSEPQSLSSKAYFILFI